MLGTSSNPGIIPRVINGIFEQIEENRKVDGDEWKYNVTFSFLEIYNEKVKKIHLHLDILEHLRHTAKYGFVTVIIT